MKISEILNIGSNKRNFKELVSCCTKNNIIPFIGAGMSVPIYRLWNDTLINISNKSFDSDFPSIIQNLLDNAAYEKAASCILQELGEGEFYSALAEEFNKNKIKKITSMAVSVLPKIFKGMVITTNFEKLLETVYKTIGNEFNEITYHISEQNVISELLTKGLVNNEHFLIKIHGDIESERSLVLTEEKYNEVYGKDSLFKQALMTVFNSKSLLFLGCSLKIDRTMMLFQEARKANKIYNYAFVQKPEDVKKAQDRSRQLSNLLIHPIWYPEHDTKHESVKVLLNYLYDQIKKENAKKSVSSEKKKLANNG